MIQPCIAATFPTSHPRFGDEGEGQRRLSACLSSLDAAPLCILDRQSNVHNFCKGKKVVIVGLPGAFTPTCSNKQIPGYLAKEAELKAKGVDAVIIYAVNDGAVIDAWTKSQNVAEGSMVQILGDPSSELTRALRVELDDSRVMGVLGNPRCKRFSMLVDDGVIKAINVAAAEDDPSGDLRPEVSMVDKMLSDL